MANVKISELGSATTPLAGTELIEIVQGGVNKKVAVSNIGSSTTPDLEAVLTEGDRPVIEASGGYDFELLDIGRFIIVYDGDVNLDDNALTFQENCELIFRNFSGSAINLTSTSQNIFQDSGAADDNFSIPDGYLVRLKKRNIAEWYMNIVPVSASGGSSTWGSITGTLASQTDLVSAIDAKVTDAIVNGVTTVAPSQNAVFDALALKSDKSRTLYASGASLTGVATESNVQTLYIPANTIQSEDAYTLTIPTYKSATAATITYNVYHGTSSGARTTLIGIFLVAASTRGTTFQRFLSFVSGNMYSNINFSTNTNNPFTATGGALSAQTLAFTTSVDNYITISANPSVTSEVIQVLDMSLTPRK